MDNVDIKNPTLYLLDFSNEVENIKDEMRFYPNDFINLDVEFEGTLAQIHAQEKSLELAWALHPDQDQPDAEAEIRRGYERAEKLATVKLSNSEKLMQLLTQNIERLDNDFAKAGVSLEPSHDGVEEFAGNRKNKRAASRGPSPAPSTSSKQRKRQ
ncbi:hypothetical protein BC936DRAFT_145638 [Jimgerdemannia flammicorona]|uniref:Inhibitor of growth protein N-terminal histone-binding domain-containing protein n=1 Tax=Jimgerdemannia flammicorona TaxID=994334 RepID=A0A433D9I6_9FUNG|nr:hypothetical protein BC936DRAFT_145638 [Jimgerdemannia flammicorona]